MVKVIDSHVHFWDPSVLRYEWLTPLDSINAPHLPSTLASEAAQIDLEGVVFVEASVDSGYGMSEARWAAGLGQMVHGIVAAAPLERGAAVQSVLEQLAAIPKVKGIRRITQHEPLGFGATSQFIEGVRLLPAYGFTCDICVFHRHLPDVITLVEACPDTQFVLDHIGKPGIAAREFDTWERHIRVLAGAPNLWCKLSGMVTEADHAAWQPADLKPYVDAVVEAFGYERLMYGSDWPVMKLAAPYTTWWQTLDTFVSRDEHDRQRLFHDNAKSFYRL